MKVPVPRRVCLAKDAMRNTKKSSLGAWDPAKSGTFTPKFYDSKGAPKKMKMRLKKDKNQDKMRNTSYANNNRRIITKSQATDTELDGSNLPGTKPNSATLN